MFITCFHLFTWEFTALLLFVLTSGCQSIDNSMIASIWFFFSSKLHQSKTSKKMSCFLNWSWVFVVAHNIDERLAALCRNHFVLFRNSEYTRNISVNDTLQPFKFYRRDSVVKWCFEELRFAFILKWYAKSQDEIIFR